MMSRGRGRGMSFNVEQLGLGKGDLPSNIVHPPPLFPSLDTKALPLEKDEKSIYLVSLKNEFRTYMQQSPMFLKPMDKKPDVKRYSDKYKSAKEEKMKLSLDWSMFPSELRPSKKRSTPVTTKRPAAKRQKTGQQNPSNTDTQKQLESFLSSNLADLEKLDSIPLASMPAAQNPDVPAAAVPSGQRQDQSAREPASSTDEGEEEEDGAIQSGEEVEQEGFESDEMEEAADYLTSYFDNGEDDDANDEDADENGPIY